MKPRRERWLNEEQRSILATQVLLGMVGFAIFVAVIAWMLVWGPVRVWGS